jgi:hypothetical protein
MQGNATAIAESHLPVLGQELPEIREKLMGNRWDIEALPILSPPMPIAGTGI